MRVLGVDPGLTRCGLAVVDGGTGRSVRFVDVGVVRTPPELDLANRLLLVADAVERWLDRHRPQSVAIERVFSQNNVSTVIGTAQVTGVVALAAARRGLPVAFHTPSEMKTAVTGSGRADKAQVTLMVTKLLGLAEPPKPADAADALGLAICHLWRSPMQSRLAQAKAQASELGRQHQARLRAVAKSARAPAAKPLPAGNPAAAGLSRGPATLSGFGSAAAGGTRAAGNRGAASTSGAAKISSGGTGAPAGAGDPATAGRLHGTRGVGKPRRAANPPEAGKSSGASTPGAAKAPGQNRKGTTR